MATSSTVTFYTGYYAGGTPTVLSANPFDVAQDLSTGNLWQYTGAAWVAPSWQTSITLWLGAAEDVCQRLKSEDTKIPDTIYVYVGTDGEVPPELALTADDLAIKHDVGNYNLNVNVLRKDVTTDTFVDVPFPEGYVVTTEDGNWTVLKNFNKCVGYDYATISLAWTTTADGQGPQSVDYVTSAEARDIAEDVMSSGGGASVDIEGGNGINVVTSGGSSVVELAVSASFDDSFTIDVVDSDFGSASLSISTQDISLSVGGVTLYLGQAECRIGPALVVSSAITIWPADGFSNPVSLTAFADGLLVNDQNVATQPWVSEYVSSHGGQSGAIIENQPFSTTVGGYTMTYTASGGLMVSDGGAIVVMSGGSVIASAYRDPDGPNDNTKLSLTPEAVSIRAAKDGIESSCELTVDSSGVKINNEHDADAPARPVAMQLVTSTLSLSFDVISVLSGGTSYVYTLPVAGIEVNSVVKTTDASYLHFTLDSVTAPTPVVISGVSYLNSATFEGGKEYLVGFFDGMCVVNEVTSGGTV